MAVHNINYVDIDLGSGTVFRSFASRTLAEGDDDFNRFGIRAFRNGQPVSLAGSTVTGQFIRPNRDTVVISNGLANGNEAYIEIPKACYAYDGDYQLAIKLTGGGVTGTVRIIDGTVTNTTTGALIDPGSVIPDLSNYESVVAAAEAAAELIAEFSIEAEVVSGTNYSIVVTTPDEE